MFDLAFSEIVVIAVIALVVLGPERLPKVARQAGEWLGKMRRYVDDVKSDINKQMELEELRSLKKQVTDAAQELQTSVQSVVSETQEQLGSLNDAFEGSGASQTQTDWDRVYATRRMRERIKDRRIEREKELGHKRPRRRLHR